MCKLSNKEWIELIEAKREEIQEAGEKAYREAMENKHLKLIVELYQNGEVDVWHTTTGGNNQTMSSYNGESIQVMSFCFQYSDVEVTDDNIIEKLVDKGLDAEQFILKAEEEDETLYTHVYNYDAEIIQEIEKENLEWEINEYASQETDTKIDQCISNYKSLL